MHALGGVTQQCGCGVADARVAGLRESDGPAGEEGQEGQHPVRAGEEDGAEGVLRVASYDHDVRALGGSDA